MYTYKVIIRDKHIRLTTYHTSGDDVVLSQSFKHVKRVRVIIMHPISFMHYGEYYFDSYSDILDYIHKNNILSKDDYYMFARVILNNV